MRVKNSSELAKKILALSELEPKPNCKLCGGRGTLVYMPDPARLLASKFREIRPCPCVKKVVEWEDG